MRRPQLAVALATGVLLVTTAAPSGAAVTGADTAAPGPSTPPAAQAAEDEFERVQLPVKVTALDALATASAADVPVQGLRYDQPNLTGEYFFDSTDDPSAAAQELTDYLEQNFGTTPQVSQLIVLDDDAAAAADVADSPELSESPAQPVPAARYVDEGGSSSSSSSSSSSRDASMSASATSEADSENSGSEDAASGSTSTYDSPPWAPSAVNFESYVYGGVANMYGVWTWDNGAGAYPRHAPGLMPTDYGIELENSLWNYSLPDKTSGCPTTRYTDFWAARNADDGHKTRSWNVFGPGGSQASLTGLGAYFDGNMILDSCRRITFTVGIGYPRKIAETKLGSRFYEIQTLVTARRGTRTSSIHELGMQAVGNECPSAPHSDCMDIRQGRAWPGPGKKTGLALNRSRNYTVPGCVFWASYTIPGRSNDCLP